MKRKVPILLILGCGLILVSLCLVVFLGVRRYLGNQTCQSVVATMNEILPERSAGLKGASQNAPLPVLEIDGVDYVALIEIPACDITLPVAGQWNSNALSQAPALFAGSVHDSPLVIGGDSQQFGFCSQIETGVLVTVTDMTGAQFHYTVTQIHRSPDAQSQWLTDPNYDLTLFCRDSTSTDYIAVRCTYGRQE